MSLDHFTSDVLFLHDKIAVSSYASLGSGRAERVARYTLSGRALEELRSVGGRAMSGIEIIELIFGIAGFIQILAELWERFGPDKIPDDDITKLFAEMDIPEDTKRKILENQEYIVAHMAAHFPTRSD